MATVAVDKRPPGWESGQEVRDPRQCHLQTKPFFRNITDSRECEKRCPVSRTSKQMAGRRWNRSLMRITVLALCLLAGGCSVWLLEDTTSIAQTLAPGSYSLSNHPSQDGRCKGDMGIGDLDRMEKVCLDQLPDVMKRHGDALHLRFRNGSTRIYNNKSTGCDTGNDSDCIKYQVVGYFPRHSLLLLEMGYYEGVRWRIVGIQTGEEINILAPPHYSPNEKWLVSVSASIGPAGGGNGIDIVPTMLDQKA
jgi:hypothetical protein